MFAFQNALRFTLFRASISALCQSYRRVTTVMRVIPPPPLFQSRVHIQQLDGDGSSPGRRLLHLLCASAPGAIAGAGARSASVLHAHPDARRTGNDADASHAHADGESIDAAADGPCHPTSTDAARRDADV